jgi:hypothetical protein
VAAIHFEPLEGNVTQNVQKLVALTTEAARHGAKIVVHTEMATSGYSFFSREQVAKVAEPIPGPSTRALGAVAKRYGIYVAFGLPEHDRFTDVYYNAVALIGPNGSSSASIANGTISLKPLTTAKCGHVCPHSTPRTDESRSSSARTCSTMDFHAWRHWQA